MDIIIIGENQFKTLVALTDEEHEKGLMFKKWPTPIMSFAFDTKEPRKFWMRNTISPLDILFCNNNKIISICHGVPLSLKLIGPNDPVDLVIEMPFGSVFAYNIAVGDPVKLKYSVNTLAKKYSENISNYAKC